MRPQDWRLLRRQLARQSLIYYIRSIAPWFRIEEIHCVIASFLESMAFGEIDRGMLFMPPRTGKSLMASTFFTSWWAGLYPSDKILQTGHSLNLSRGFSLDVRSIMQDPEYRFIFPGVRLAKDSKAAGRWRVEDTIAGMERVEAAQARAYRQQQGQYNAAGVTSNIAGIGFNLGVVDDAMSEQDKDSKVTKDRIWNWWGPGFYTRRQPERNAILVMMTRWANDDLAGHLLEQQEKHHGADIWTVLNVPAILDRDNAKMVYEVAKEYGQIGMGDDLRELKAGDSFSPRRWSETELERSRANMTERDWNALYMGNPDVDEGHILKEKHWRLWPHADEPDFIEIFMMYDTAFEKGETNDFSAFTVWGLFEYRERQDERPQIHMMLLGTWERKVDAPDLVTVVKAFAWGSKETRKAMEEERRHPDFEFLDELVDEYGVKGGDPKRPDDKEIPGFHPNRIMVEKKASGLWLTKELRRVNHPRRLPMQDWLPPRAKGGVSKGQEMGKYARAHYGNLVLEQGGVWYLNRRWATAVIKKCAATKFDGSDAHDDVQDTVVASFIHVRQTYRVDFPSDVDLEKERQPKKKAKRQFYGARVR